MATSKSTTKKATVAKTQTKAATPAKVATTAPKPKKSAASAPADREKIAARAYEIWEEVGKPEGGAAEHWARAEQELNGKR